MLTPIPIIIITIITIIITTTTTGGIIITIGGTITITGGTIIITGIGTTIIRSLRLNTSLEGRYFEREAGRLSRAYC